MVIKMASTNKCCSGNIQNEFIITGGNFQSKIKQSEDSCTVLKIPANLGVYIVSEDRFISSESKSSPTSESTNNTNLIIAIIILSVLMLLFFGLMLYFAFRKPKVK